MRSIITALVAMTAVAGCSGSARAPAASDTRSAAATVERDAEPAASVDGESDVLCLPVVSGCGCAYACGTPVRRNDDGTWEITHDFMDRATLTASVERRCFTPDGHSWPETVAGDADVGPCRDVFYDRSACGGECIPTPQFTVCVRTGDRCLAAGPSAPPATP
jgi:hypothetical protein